jgi:hypothetical protein
MKFRAAIEEEVCSIVVPLVVLLVEQTDVLPVTVMRRVRLSCKAPMLSSVLGARIVLRCLSFIFFLESSRKCSILGR